jgi:hypothetical protein
MTEPTSSEENKLDVYLRLLAECYEKQSPPPDLAARIGEKMNAQNRELSDQEMEWLSAAGTVFLPEEKPEDNS